MVSRRGRMPAGVQPRRLFCFAPPVARGTFVFDPSQAATSVSTARDSVSTPEMAVTSETSTPTFTADGLDNLPPTVPVVVPHGPELAVTLGSVLKATAVVATSPPTALSGAVQRAFAVAVSKTKSSAANDAILETYGSALNPAVASATITQSVDPWAWLAIENSWNSSDQNWTTDSQTEALDKVLARFGV